MPRVARTDAEERLLNALRERLRLDGRSVRQIEAEVGLGHGTLGNVLRGKSELRFHHLEGLGAVLGFTVPEIVAEAYEETSEKAGLRSLLAEVVRRELDALRKDRG
jgi:transcriptional regulator with XRE-family HTH domain